MGETAVVEAQQDKEEVVESVMERIASGGHAESDELDPFVAEWQLTFIPTVRLITIGGSMCKGLAMSLRWKYRLNDDDP